MVSSLRRFVRRRRDVEETCFCGSSSHVDDAWREVLFMEPAEPPEPWWASGPEVAEVASGLLAEARDDLDRARLRYAQAIRAGRIAGYSWAEIGRLLGVSKQSLHRRFGALG
jgi:DNA-directed RNA polymerase specialized sigma24 family protein